MNAEAKQMELAGVPEKPLVVRDEATAMLEMIERVALSEKADVEKMRALLDMRKEIIAEEARIRFNEAMARVQAAGVRIKNDRRNQQTNSNYASLMAISNALTPHITREGFSMSYGTGKAEFEGWIRITCDVALGGHEIHRYVDLPLDTSGIQGKRNKTDMHGAKSALTYGRVILKLLIFDVATADDIDDDGNAAGGKVPELIDEKQVIELREWIGAIGEGHEKFDAEKWEAKFCHSLGIDALEVMPAEMLGKAKNLLKKAEAAK